MGQEKPRVNDLQNLNMEGFPFTYENRKQTKTKEGEGKNTEDCDLEKAWRLKCREVPKNGQKKGISGKLHK